MDGYSLVKLYHVTECSFVEGQMGDYNHKYYTNKYYASKGSAEQRVAKLGGIKYKDGYAVQLEEVVLVEKNGMYYDLKLRHGLKVIC